MNLIINDDKLQIKEIDEFHTKVRALLITEENQVLIASYSGVLLLPGGSLESREPIVKAIVRELKEETGQCYKSEDFRYLTCLEYFQKDYPKRDGSYQNRLVKTYYFIADYKSPLEVKHFLSESERSGNFMLKLVPLNEIDKLIAANNTDNPRNVYFQKELATIIKFYKNAQTDISEKRKQLK